MKFSALAVFLLSGTLVYSQETPADFLAPRMASLGLPLPEWNSVLAASSGARALELQDEGVLAHEDGKGRRVGAQLAAAGFPAGEFGEVLGAGPTLEAVWKAWMESPTHRGVLSEAWKLWGWGRSERAGVSVWVIRFWRP